MKTKLSNQPFVKQLDRPSEKFTREAIRTAKGTYIVAASWLVGCLPILAFLITVAPSDGNKGLAE
jgi:hypothetical protein